MTGAAEAAEAYRKNKEMDFYQYMVTLAGIDRRPAKDLYLGRSYGMGKKKLAMKLNRPIEEAEKILEVFDQNLPFIKEIADSCDQSAQNRGYIKTLLGRRRHFEWWEPWNSWKRRQEGEKIEPRRVDEARQMWPGTRLVRTDTRKALNALIQGSAADMIKAAMVQLDEVGTLPYMTIHDEIDCPINDERHAKEVLEVMEHCVEMTVPVYCDMDLGKGWK
jgi:DNA polymerase-1